MTSCPWRQFYWRIQNGFRCSSIGTVICQNGICSCIDKLQIRVSNPFALDSIDGTETVVRAVHDYRAAIRYFKKDFSENGNIYGIDTSLIFAGGVSAGAITAVHVAYMDNPFRNTRLH